MNPNPNKQRILKVELAGDMFYGKTYPKIRIQGRWLAELVFNHLAASPFTPRSPVNYT